MQTYGILTNNKEEVLKALKRIFESWLLKTSEAKELLGNKEETKENLNYIESRTGIDLKKNTLVCDSLYTLLNQEEPDIEIVEVEDKNLEWVMGTLFPCYRNKKKWNRQTKAEYCTDCYFSDNFGMLCKYIVGRDKSELIRILKEKISKYFIYFGDDVVLPKYITEKLKTYSTVFFIQDEYDLYQRKLYDLGVAYGDAREEINRKYGEQ